MAFQKLCSTCWIHESQEGSCHHFHFSVGGEQGRGVGRGSEGRGGRERRKREGEEGCEGKKEGKERRDGGRGGKEK